MLSCSSKYFSKSWKMIHLDGRKAPHDEYFKLYAVLICIFTICHIHTYTCSLTSWSISALIPAPLLIVLVWCHHVWDHHMLQTRQVLRRDYFFFKAVSRNRWTQTLKATHRCSPDGPPIQESGCFSSGRNRPVSVCMCALIRYIYLCRCSSASQWHHMKRASVRQHSMIASGHSSIPNTFILHLKTVVTLV